MNIFEKQHLRIKLTIKENFVVVIDNKIYDINYTVVDIIKTIRDVKPYERYEFLYLNETYAYYLGFVILDEVFDVDDYDYYSYTISSSLNKKDFLHESYLEILKYRKIYEKNK